jgi:hypothetical protein
MAEQQVERSNSGVPSRTQFSSKALTERALKRKIDSVLRLHVIKDRNFIPEASTLVLKRWLNGLELTIAEREIAWRMTDEILSMYERRMKQLRTAIIELMCK